MVNAPMADPPRTNSTATTGSRPILSDTQPQHTLPPVLKMASSPTTTAAACGVTLIRSWAIGEAWPIIIMPLMYPSVSIHARR